MPTLKREDQAQDYYDEKFNSHPDLQNKENQAGSEYASSGADQAEAYANDPSNSARGLSNREDQLGKLSTDTGFYKQDQNEKKSRPSRVFGIFRSKKAGPLGFIGLVSLLGLFGISFLTPGLAIIQLKEMFTEDLNDQLAAMDIRTTYVMKAKLNDMGKGALCTSISPAKCKFRGMSDRQIKKFERAGIKIEKDGDKNSITRKTNIKSMEFSDGTKITNPASAKKLLYSNPTVRNELRRAFNPKFAGFYDNVSAKVFSRFKTSKADKLTGTTDEERIKNVDDAVAGNNSQLEAAKYSASEDDENKTNKDNADKALSEQDERIKASPGFSSGTGSVLKGAVKGVGIIGAADNACTVYNTSRAVGASAKAIRAVQLASYAMIANTAADEAKAGVGTPEKMEFLGNIVTATDTQKKVFDETTTDDKGNLTKEVDNPYYGKNAFDSEGYRMAAYNDAPTLTARAGQFSLGGGLIGRLASINAKVEAAIPGGAKEKCGFIQNGWVRGGSIVIGVFAGVFSLGASTAVSVGASVAVAAALPILESYLADIVAGKTVSGKTKGVDAGNALFAGNASIMGSVAMSRGLKPANKSELKSYLAKSNTIKSEYVAMETEDAKSTPFDIYNKYSFIGSISRKLTPTMATVRSNLANIPSFSLDLFGTATDSLTPSSLAVGKWNEQRYSKCEDDGYKELNIDADVFCNVRYVMSDKELAMDTDEVIDYMVNNGQIAEDGTPQNDYADWLKECTERTSGWGETPEGQENGGIGERCIEKGDGTTSLDGKLTANQLSNFRVYTIDNSINEAMEYEGLSNTGDLKVMTYNVRKDSLTDSSDRNKLITQTISERQPDIIGFQEMEESQAGPISSALPDYTFTEAELGRTRRIAWKTSSFTLVDKGTWNSTKKVGSSQMPWVKLSTQTGKSLFVFDVHTEPASESGSSESQKKDAQKLREDIIPKATSNDTGPVLVIGDMNSGYPGQRGDMPISFYEEFTKDNTYKLAFNEASESDRKNSDCSTGHEFGKQRCKRDNARHIDQIYYSASSNATTKKWENIVDDTTSDASDHNPVIAELSIPGITASDTQAIAGGGIQGDDYAKECAQYKKFYRSICNGQCVSFVMFRLLKHKAIDSIVFGHGKDVAAALGRRGFPVSKTPTVNSVFSTNRTSQPQYGHTGMVSKVNSDGSIEVEEYNYNTPLKYGTRTIKKSEYQSKNFVFADVSKAYQP